jgi:hypothetical protein
MAQPGPSVMAEKTRPVRLTQEAIDLARIAASFAKESMADYVCRIIAERARADIERYYAEMHRPGTGPEPGRKATPRPKKGG